MKFYTPIFRIFQSPGRISNERVCKSVLTNIADFGTGLFDMNLAMMNANKDTDEEIEMKRN